MWKMRKDDVGRLRPAWYVSTPAEVAAHTAASLTLLFARVCLSLTFAAAAVMARVPAGEQCTCRADAAVVSAPVAPHRTERASAAAAGHGSTAVGGAGGTARGVGTAIKRCPHCRESFRASSRAKLKETMAMHYAETACGEPERARLAGKA